MSDPFYHDPALYDAMYADLTADIPLFVDMAKAAGGPVLEVCCGNGRLLVPAARAGIDIDGLDLSPEMLAGLRAKLAAAGVRAGVHEGDMADFALPRRYALVFVAFNSFLHNLTQAEQIATLRCCRAHLAPGGRLALGLFHPSAQHLLEWAAGEKVVKDIPNAIGPGRVRVIDRTVDERVEQVRRVTRRVEFLDDAGAIVRTATLPFSIRYVFKPEMELLLRAAGFGRWCAQPLDRVEGACVAAGRPPQEGDMLLWTAWDD